ncbi:hypothetical protein J31TS4_36500 [Paenibacillus sp. J31TS4]|uniref:NUDIX domain-containing protein n=1 Tax=Paenibacillus sp. J31TS4 TaxID=2807195 RepID=UPI001B2A4E01|nr:NUDIX hydrolase [Paenibacillus sp. J31TS4]GIP40370.1 hypothetical protein J31TS4_36500 [Paenibacillus sp. J31TS4]
MLIPIEELPRDKRIAGVHAIPLAGDGAIVMVWDRNESRLTTVGGRVEGTETPMEALDRETVEEAGLLLKAERVPVACWHWASTDTYTVYFVAEVDRLVPMPDGFETSGRVVSSFETAGLMVRTLEGAGPRLEILRLAEEKAQKLGMGGVEPRSLPNIPQIPD